MKDSVRSLRTRAAAFLEEEDGIGSVEMILILVVLISIVLIFKKQITSLTESIWKTITNKAKQV